MYTERVKRERKGDHSRIIIIVECIEPVVYEIRSGRSESQRRGTIAWESKGRGSLVSPHYSAGNEQQMLPTRRVYCVVYPDLRVVNFFLENNFTTCKVIRIRCILFVYIMSSRCLNFWKNFSIFIFLRTTRIDYGTIMLPCTFRIYSRTTLPWILWNSNNETHVYDFNIGKKREYCFVKTFLIMYKNSHFHKSTRSYQI